MFNVVSLFSGCGGLDLGFKEAGFKIVYANDINRFTASTYEKNLGKIHIKNIVNVDKNSLPDCDVVLAGIPCQPFSNAGKKRGVKDPKGILFKEVINTLIAKKPKAVVFENVKGFLTAKDDEGALMVNRLKYELSRLGYNSYYKLLNASEYGVPQQRKRVFIVGVRSDINAPFEFPEPIGASIDLTIDSVVSEPLPTDEQEEVMPLSPSQEFSKHIPEGGGWLNVDYKNLPPRFQNMLDSNNLVCANAFSRQTRHEIAKTITASAQPEFCAILHPYKNRRYSVREVARIQSFPDSFKFINTSARQKYRMIGNAVPPLLAQHVAYSVLKTLTEG